MGNGGSLGHLVDDGGFHKSALSVTSDEDASACIYGILDLTLYLHCRLFIDQGADLGGGNFGISCRDGFHTFQDFFHKGVLQRSVDQETLGRAADLTGVIETGVCRLIDRQIQVGIGKDDEGVVSAKLQGDMAEAACCGGCHIDSHLRGTGEGDGMDVLMAAERISHGCAASGDDLEHALWNAGFHEEFTQLQNRDRIVGGRLYDGGIAGKQGGRHLLVEQVAGEIKGNDAGDHANGFPLRQNEVPFMSRLLTGRKDGAVEMFCLFREGSPGGEDISDFHGSLVDIFAGFQGQGHGELFLLLLHKLKKTVHNSRTLMDRNLFPAFLCFLCRQNRTVDIESGGRRNLVYQGTVVGIDDIDGGMVRRGDEFAVDQHVHSIPPV